MRAPVPDAQWPKDMAKRPAMPMREFCELVWRCGIEQYRDLPWRHTHDPYAIWISEVMLQQTQVKRVDGRWQRWMQRFPTVEALSCANTVDVLEEWQGLGYNRRALSLHKAAAMLLGRSDGFPTDEKDLQKLPGIGPATAAGIRAFAFGLPSTYVETNVRTVFLHELYPGEEHVPDAWLVPLVRAACSEDDPRGWYYALLDYGAWLKRTVPNPSRRSSMHTRQSGFEGSHRQKRAMVVRMLLAARSQGITPRKVADDLHVSVDVAHALLSELAAEGFCKPSGDIWYI